MTSMTPPAKRQDAACDECGDPGSRASADADDRDQPPERSRAPRAGERDLFITMSDESGSAASRLDVAWIEQRLGALLPLLPKPVTRLGVEIADDARMTQLHKQFCSDESTTDVLTFPLEDDASVIDVDIAVCADHAQRRVEASGTASPSRGVERELLLYILHGLLHCCGFDDHDQASYRAMHAEEDRLLEAIGVGRVFHSEASGHDDALAFGGRDEGMTG